MKVFDFNAMFLLLVVTMFIVVVQARSATENIRMAWDFRDNTWKTIEFLGNNKNQIKVLTTAEDVTKLVFVEYVEGKNIFAIKEK